MLALVQPRIEGDREKFNRPLSRPVKKFEQIFFDVLLYVEFKICIITIYGIMLRCYNIAGYKWFFDNFINI